MEVGSATVVIVGSFAVLPADSAAAAVGSARTSAAKLEHQQLIDILRMVQ